jgi:transposase InsO family protein
LRFTGPEIAETLAMALSTVSGILTRIGMGKLGRLGLEPVERYERARPGELIHIDVKKLGRIARPGHAVLGGQAARAAKGYHRQAHSRGWEFVHIAIDDCTRLAYVEVLDDERKETVTAFLERAVAWFAARGVIIERLMTDNGSAYRSALHRRACRALGIRHLFTRPYRPRTNGKAERFIRTLLAGWAYQRAYTTGAERRAALAAFVAHYNTQRPHRSLNGQTPMTRLAERNKTAAAYS